MLFIFYKTSNANVCRHEKAGRVVENVDNIHILLNHILIAAMSCLVLSTLMALPFHIKGEIANESDKNAKI